MRGLVRVEVPGVLALVAHTSALDLMRPDTDVDVAVVPTAAAPADSWAFFGFPEDLAERLGSWQGHPFPVAVLQAASDPTRLDHERAPGSPACVRARPRPPDRVPGGRGQPVWIDGWRYWRAVEEVVR